MTFRFRGVEVFAATPQRANGATQPTADTLNATTTTRTLPCAALRCAAAGFALRCPPSTPNIASTNTRSYVRIKGTRHNVKHTTVLLSCDFPQLRCRLSVHHSSDRSSLSVCVRLLRTSTSPLRPLEEGVSMLHAGTLPLALALSLSAFCFHQPTSFVRSFERTTVFFVLSFILSLFTLNF